MVDIFNGMYSLIKSKKPLSDKQIAHRDPVPILSANQLLGTEKRQQILTDTSALLSLPNDEYERIFLKVTENFAEFVQNLPETERSYYANIGGLLDHALERTSLSLFLCRTYLLPEDASLASVSESEMLWVYAVYTASLLYDIGKIATKHIVTLTDEKGSDIKSWLPYNAPMTHQNASHYVYNFSEEHHDRIRWGVTPLLARQVLPEEGFAWIASDMGVLESWLALLNDELRTVGSLLSVIPLADAQLLESYFTDRKVFRHSLSPQTVASLAEMQKNRKELLKRQKELREKILAEGLERANITKTEDQSKIHPKDESKKTSKQFLFGLLAKQEDKKIQAISHHDAKEITQQFINWLQQSADRLNKSDAKNIQRAESGLLIDQKVLQQFIVESNISNLNIVGLEKLMAQTDIAKPVTYTQVVEAALKTGQMNDALLVQNPYLVFPAGPPPLAAIIGVNAAVLLELPQRTMQNVQQEEPRYESQNTVSHPTVK
jgi:integrating conjugative element relaxase (TIGR03760 family)